MESMNEETLHTETIYEGRILGLEKIQVRLMGGSESFREVVRHGEAVAVMLRIPNGPYIFVRQFRKPVEQIVFEAVAGNLDPGEDPEEGARREIAEETGYQVQRLHPLGFLYPSPGYCEEKIHLFYAEVTSEQTAQSLDEDEQVEVVLVPPDEVEAMISDGRVVDGKTLALWAKVSLLQGTKV